MDIFVSYASEDRERVEPLVRLLETAGFTVWWDHRIEAGKSFDRVIEEALANARCVVVVWSNQSVESDWVREEANDGLRRGILVPVQIEPCQIPLGFRRIHAAQLLNWPWSRPDLAPLLERIGSVAGAHPASAVRSTEKPSRVKWIASVAAAATLIAIACLYGSGRVGTSPPHAPNAAAEGPSIAVLPFKDMSPDGDQDYFSDGIAEELLNVLSRLEGLRVASRTSSFSFKSSNADLRTAPTR